MAVFQYSGTDRNREDQVESGTVLARDEVEAKEKLQPFHLDGLRLRRLGGLRGMLQSLSPDVK